MSKPSNPTPPPTPLWFARLTDEWQAVEQFHGVLGATLRKKQLERLKSARNIEFTCRTYRPGKVKLYARVSIPSQDQF